MCLTSKIGLNLHFTLYNFFAVFPPSECSLCKYLENVNSETVFKEQGPSPPPPLI